jgi:hypothetical protein
MQHVSKNFAVGIAGMTLGLYHVAGLGIAFAIRAVV